jgi:hypothetical protein
MLGRERLTSAGTRWTCRRWLPLNGIDAIRHELTNDPERGLMGVKSLQRPERVAVIGVGSQAKGSPTGWSFSWVNASNKTECRSYFDLNVAGMAAHSELAETIGPDSWWHPSGHLRWAAWDYRVDVCTGDEVRRRLEPALTVCDIGIGANGSIRAVTLSDGSRLEVDAVVNAAGPGASRVAGLVGRHLPMRREPGAIMGIDCAQVPIHRAMHKPHVETTRLFSHSGITLGPVIGRLLASEILSGKRDEMLSDFRPERFTP